MSRIPRKLNNIEGIVIVRYVGNLPYENEEDKKRLQALSKIFIKAVLKGIIKISKNGLPQLKATKSTEYSIFRKLSKHGIINYKLVKSKFSHERLSKVREKSKREILILDEEDLARLFRPPFWKRWFGKKQ